MMHLFFSAPPRSRLRLATALLFIAQRPFLSTAQVAPIPLTPESFNQDVVVERTAPRPVRPATTASVETGLSNTGYSWFEKGYNQDWPATGLPTAGSTVNSAFTMDHDYQFAPDYRTNNAILIDSAMTHAQIVPSAPGAWAALSFLLSGAHDSMSASIQLRVHHADSSLETGTIRCPDWLDSVPYYAYTPNGRVHVGNFTFANLNANLPKMFSADVALTNPASPVTEIELSYVSGGGHSFIMALSAAMEPNGPFTPIAFTGYNVDAVVEAAALRPQALTGATTASMASGSLNTLWTWYERGYVPDAPETGLPAANAQLTNALGGHVFQLAPDYAQGNAAVLDSDTPILNLIPSTPVACQLLSFLTAAAGGQATNLVGVQHADGITQTNWLISPDWTDTQTPAVFNCAGRINLNTRLLDSLGGSIPRLFAADLEVSNSVSPVTNIMIHARGTSPVRAVFFAVSGGSGGPEPVPVLSVEPAPDGKILLRTTVPGQLEWTTELRGANTEWQNGGAISGSVSLDSGAAQRFFRVVKP